MKIGHNNSERRKEMDNAGSQRTEAHKSEAACGCTAPVSAAEGGASTGSNLP